MADTNAVNHFLDLDLYEYTSYPVVKAQQGDSGRYLTCRLKDHEEVYVIPQDCGLITLEGIRPNNTNFSIEGNIDRPNSMVEFNLTQAITQFGDVKAKVVIYEGTPNDSDPSSLPPIISSIPLYIEVEENYAGIPSEEEETIIRVLERRLNAHVGNKEIHRAIVYSATEPTERYEGDQWLKEYS